MEYQQELINEAVQFPDLKGKIWIKQRRTIYQPC